MNALVHIPRPPNEPVTPYAPGTPEREELKSTLASLRSSEIEIPLLIGGREVRTGSMGRCVCPHDHGHTLATYHKAGPDEVRLAIEAASKAWKTT